MPLRFCEIDRAARCVLRLYCPGLPWCWLLLWRWSSYFRFHFLILYQPFLFCLCLWMSTYIVCATNDTARLWTYLQSIGRRSPGLFDQYAALPPRMRLPQPATKPKGKKNKTLLRKTYNKINNNRVSLPLQNHGRRWTRHELTIKNLT
jgi:hypothetical protein